MIKVECQADKMCAIPKFFLVVINKLFIPRTASYRRSPWAGALAGGKSIDQTGGGLALRRERIIFCSRHSCGHWLTLAPAITGLLAAGDAIDKGINTRLLVDRGKTGKQGGNEL